MVVSRGAKCTFRPCGKYSKAVNLSFFTFPKEVERCRRWITAAQRPDLLELLNEIHSKGKDLTYFSRNYTLCSDHFEDHCFMNAREKKRLVTSAVPTLFGAKQPSSRPPMSGKRGRPARHLRSAHSRALQQVQHDEQQQQQQPPQPLVINIPGNMVSPVIINIPGSKSSPLIINVADGQVYTSLEPREAGDTMHDLKPRGDAVHKVFSPKPAPLSLTRRLDQGLTGMKSHKRKRRDLSVITISSPSKSGGASTELVSSKRVKSVHRASEFTDAMSATIRIKECRQEEGVEGSVEVDGYRPDVKVFSSAENRPPRLINIAAFSPMVDSPSKAFSEDTEDLYNSTMSVCSASLDGDDSYPDDEQEAKFIPPVQRDEWREYRPGHLTPLYPDWDPAPRPPLCGLPLKLKKVQLQQRRPQLSHSSSRRHEDSKPVFSPLDEFLVKREPPRPCSPSVTCLSSSSSDDSNSEDDLDQTGLHLTSKLRRFRTHRDIVRSSLGPVSALKSPSSQPLCGGPAHSSDEIIRRMASTPSLSTLPTNASKNRRRTLHEMQEKINGFDLELSELASENQLLTRELYIYRSKKHIYREKLRKLLRNVRAKDTRRHNKDACVLQYCQQRMPLATFKFFKCQLLSCKCPQWDFDSMQIPVIAKRCGLGVRETFYQILRMPAFRTFTNYRNILKKNPSVVQEGNIVRDDFMKKYHRKLERRKKGPREPTRRKTCKTISSAIKDYLMKNEEGVIYEQ